MEGQTLCPPPSKSPQYPCRSLHQTVANPGRISSTIHNSVFLGQCHSRRGNTPRKESVWREAGYSQNAGRERQHKTVTSQYRKKENRENNRPVPPPGSRGCPQIPDRVRRSNWNHRPGARRAHTGGTQPTSNAACDFKGEPRDGRNLRIPPKSGASKPS